MIDNWHQKLKNKNRRELIAAGKALFTEQGLSHVNIKDICEQADMSRVTFYKHFQSMDELIFEVQMELMESMSEFVEAAGTDISSGKNKLRSMLMAWAEFARRHPGYIKFIVSFDLHYSAYQSSPELVGRYKSFVKDKIKHHFLLDPIKAGIADQSLRPELNASETAQFLFVSMMGLLQRISLSSTSPKDSLTPQRFIDMLIEYMSNDHS